MSNRPTSFPPQESYFNYIPAHRLGQRVTPGRRAQHHIVKPGHHTAQRMPPRTVLLVRATEERPAQHQLVPSAASKDNTGASTSLSSAKGITLLSALPSVRAPQDLFALQAAP